MENENLTIKTSVFEGPLSLLLELVQKRKVFINDIALADIAEEFIATIQNKEGGNVLEREASFIQVAATLLLLKSRSLLPNFNLSPEEEESTQELARRLEMFEKVRSYASALENLYGKNVFLNKPAEKNIEFKKSIFTPEERFSGELFLERLRVVREGLTPREMPQRVSVKQTIRLEDVIENLTKRVRKHVALSFREYAKFGESSKEDVVVHFIALLELVKQGFLDAIQSEKGGDIELRGKEIGVPNYS